MLIDLSVGLVKWAGIILLDGAVWTDVMYLLGSSKIRCGLNSPTSVGMHF